MEVETELRQIQAREGEGLKLFGSSGGRELNAFPDAAARERKKSD